jgi:hypothetical protein
VSALLKYQGGLSEGVGKMRNTGRFPKQGS